MCGLLGNYILTISHLYKLNRKGPFHKLDYCLHDPKTKQEEGSSRSMSVGSLPQIHHSEYERNWEQKS